MKERGIIFNTEMVKAILVGQKTQTRRVVNAKGLDWIHGDKFVYVENPEEGVSEVWWDVIRGEPTFVDQDYAYIDCPYGKPGDRLYVRETWRPKAHQFPTGHPYEYKATAEYDGVSLEEPWKPSIHMPKRAARIWLEITDIRVERVRDISDQDAIAEGCESYHWNPAGVYVGETAGVGHKSRVTARDDFSYLWDSINSKRDDGKYSWESNPWVWVIEFKVLSTRGKP